MLTGASMLRETLWVVVLALLLASMVFWVLALVAARSFARFRRFARFARSARSEGLATTKGSAGSLVSEGSAVRPAGAGTVTLPPVSLLVPLCGAYAGAEEVYGAFCRQEYPGHQVVFGVRDPDDPSVPLVEGLIASHPERDIALVVGGASIGSNPKVNNLHNMLARARHETLVLTDGDILVSPDFLAQVVPPLTEPGVGMVTCLYRSCGAGGLAARLEAVGISGELAPRVLVARLVEGIRFGLGATMATTRSVLRAAGGLPAVADYLAEDFKLASLIGEAGYEIRLSPHVVETVVAPAGMGAMLRHHLRWSRTVRACRPGGYLSLLATHATALALLAVLLEHGTVPSVVLPAAAVVLHVLAVWVVGVRTLGDRTLRRNLWLLPLRDLLDFGVWWVSLLGRRVEWRGSTFTVVDDGKLAPSGGRV